ncbi:MAG: PAS domain S-box protein [Patescibacteria group bacterium]|nr:PAS domain S-box protein [Patescibacteria group bacterium]
MLSPFLIFRFFDFAVAAIFGLLVLYRNPRNKLNRLYFLFSMTFAIWQFVSLNLYSASSFRNACFWGRMEFFWPFAGAFLAHFLILFTKQVNLVKKKFIFLIIYGIPAIYSIAAIFFPSFTTSTPEFSPEEGIWYYGQYNEVLYYLIVVYLMMIILTFIVIGFGYYKTLKNTTKRLQTKAILIGLIIPVIITIIDEAAYYFDIPSPIPPLSPLLFLCIFLGYAMWKYELFALDVMSAAESTMATMSDALLLVDPEGIITDINKSVTKLLGYEDNELIGKKIGIIFPQTEGDFWHEKIWKELEKGPAINDLEVALRTKEGKIIPGSSSAALVRDKNKKILGTIYIVRDISERKNMENDVRLHMKELKKINEILVGREMQMIKLKNENSELKRKLTLQKNIAPNQEDHLSSGKEIESK